jgi:hypothetical protein
MKISAAALVAFAGSATAFAPAQSNSVSRLGERTALDRLILVRERERNLPSCSILNVILTIYTTVDCDVSSWLERSFLDPLHED